METPGHAPSHVCLYQPERRLLISGFITRPAASRCTSMPGPRRHPVQEFLDSLDKVSGLDARLALAGHGRPFTDVAGHIAANRTLVQARLDAVLAAIAAPRTAYEIAHEVYGERFNELTASWLLSKTLCYLGHLERRGLAQGAGERPERWSAAA